MISDRYIKTNAFIKGIELIPFWDKRIELHNEQYQIEGSPLQMVEAMYDMIGENLIRGITINVFPKKTEFEVGQSVYHEVSKYVRVLTETLIKSITYDICDTEIKKVSEEDAKHWEIQNYQPDTVYVIKFWKPTYHCDDEFTTIYSRKLYHKA